MANNNVIKKKVPRTVLDELEFQPCPICGNEYLEIEDESEKYEMHYAFHAEYVYNRKVFVECSSCHLRADVEHWNNLQYKKEIENDTSN